MLGNELNGGNVKLSYWRSLSVCTLECPNMTTGVGEEMNIGNQVLNLLNKGECPEVQSVIATTLLIGS